MKICSRCSGQNEDFDRICTHCGANLDGTDENSYQRQGQTSGYFVNNEPYIPQYVKTNNFAIASLVLGIVSIPFICCCYIGLITAILSVIFGFVARSNIMKSAGREKGSGMALAGIILGFSAIGLAIILLILSFVNVFSSEEFLNEFKRQFQNKTNGGSI